ncbi:hypothetical protein [Tunturiibacter gelidiferens]|uniref:Uncharacterized protein n=1 Tax=Tunturiibacter gelidiferens TaxID=3069689 RepID=A0AAU7YW34_9BACT
MMRLISDSNGEIDWKETIIASLLLERQQIACSLPRDIARKSGMASDPELCWQGLDSY